MSNLLNEERASLDSYKKNCQRVSILTLVDKTNAIIVKLTLLLLKDIKDIILYTKQIDLQIYFLLYIVLALLFTQYLAAR